MPNKKMNGLFDGKNSGNQENVPASGCLDSLSFCIPQTKLLSAPIWELMLEKYWAFLIKQKEIHIFSLERVQIQQLNKHIHSIFLSSFCGYLLVFSGK